MTDDLRLFLHAAAIAALAAALYALGRWQLRRHRTTSLQRSASELGSGTPWEEL